MPRSIKEWIGKNDDSSPPRSVYLRLFEASGGLCAECGIKVHGKGWEADHRIRLKDGGENRESNLQLLCKQCHQAKTVDENKKGARASRIKARHVGIKKRKRGGFRGWRKFDGTIIWKDDK